MSAPDHTLIQTTEHAINQTHQSAEHAVHELPNFITVLHNTFPETAIISFFHHWENIIFSLIAAGIILTLFIRAARKKTIVPRGIQNFCEFLVDGIQTFVVGILGERGRAHVPFLGTLFVYILLMNWMGLIPLLKSPTSGWSITVALALFTTVYVQAVGIKEQGLGHYLKHIAGNPQNAFGFVLIPLMLAINISVEFIAVPLSLSLRLFANISSEDRLLYQFAELNVLFSWVPFFFQIFANFLALAFSIVQAFVFMLLSTVYISLVLPHDDHHGHEIETKNQALVH